MPALPRSAILAAAALACVPIAPAAADARSDAAGRAAAAGAAPPPIVVTAGLRPAAGPLAAATVTVIGRDTLAALGTSQGADLLRLVPGVSVGQAGALGNQTQLRIRGAEANHTLVLIDGIRMNDPAASSEFRFETLAADGLDRIEVLRGPASALWGPEAIGGVVALATRRPERPFASATAEGGSFGTARGAVSAGWGTAQGGVALHADYLRTSGTDAFDALPDERESFDRLTLHGRAVLTPAPGGELGLVARYARSDSAFDGTDPLTFRRADTLDASRVESLSLRGHGRVETLGGRWWHELSATYLDTSNRNRRAGAPLNRTEGQRFEAGYLTSLSLALGATRHRLSALARTEEQGFRARDTEFLGGTDQDRRRRQNSVAGEWRFEAGDWLALQASLRHDWNSGFRDATTGRVAGIAGLGAGFSLHAAWGEGIADPTFTEQFGFFPGSFIGNPDVRPERQRGWEAGLGWTRAGVELVAIYHRARLRDEIISTFDPATFLSSVANARGISRRQGVELSAAWVPLPGMRLDLGYTWLDASQQRDAGGPRTREIRRPHHSASASASLARGPWRLGASLAWVGARDDLDFDSFPARTVRLDDYALLGARAGWRVTPAVELFARVENALGSDYEDVFQYATPGRAAYGGVRLAWGD